jgi:protein pelota
VCESSHSPPGRFSYTQHRASDPKERKKYVALVEDVQRKGGEVLRFSSMHESGQREFTASICYEDCDDLFQELNQLTGIAAILTFPLDVEVVEMEEREAGEQEDGEAEERIDNSAAPARTS